jgi:hypothetical protein
LSFLEKEFVVEIREMEMEAEQIAASSDYQELAGYIAEHSDSPAEFRHHWWLARLVFARLRRRIKQKLRRIKTAREKWVFYQTLRKNLPAFARSFNIL